MSEQWTPTTDQVRSFYAHDSEDEYHDPIAYPSHVRSAEQAFDRWLAQVRREAKIEALREAADAALAEELRKQLPEALVVDAGNVDGWTTDVGDMAVDHERTCLHGSMGIIDLRHIAAIAAQIVEGAYND